MQESARKDVERAFGVLQAIFAIVAQPAQGWIPKNLQRIMTCCVILHNMIIENERGMKNEDFSYETCSAVVTAPDETRSLNFSQFVSSINHLHESEIHYQLRNDLVVHL